MSLLGRQPGAAGNPGNKYFRGTFTELEGRYCPVTARGHYHFLSAMVTPSEIGSMQIVTLRAFECMT